MSYRGKMMRKLADIINNYKDIYLLGATSRTSMALQTEMSSYGRTFAEIWNERIMGEDEIKNLFQNKPFQNQDVLVILALEMRYLEKWTRICKEAGINYTDGYEVIYSDLYFQCQSQGKENLLERCKSCKASYHSCPVRREYYDNKKTKVLRHVAFKAGFVCNLRCKYCCEYLPYFDKSHIVPFDAQKYITDLKKLSDCSEYIKILSFSGGDVMLNEDLAQIIDHAASLPNVGDMYILTNGTYVPGKRVLDALERNREQIHIIINDYELNGAAKELTAELQKRSVRCNRRPNSGWYDLTDISFRNRSVAELKELYEHCTFDWNDNSYYIYCNGVINMRCGVANGILHYADLYEACKESYVNIRDFAPEELAEQINRIEEKGYVEMCNYCSGCDLEKRNIKAADTQIKGQRGGKA